MRVLNQNVVWTSIAPLKRQSPLLIDSHVPCAAVLFEVVTWRRPHEAQRWRSVKLDQLAFCDALDARKTGSFPSREQSFRVHAGKGLNRHGRILAVTRLTVNDSDSNCPGNDVSQFHRVLRNESLRCAHAFVPKKLCNIGSGPAMVVQEQAGSRSRAGYPDLDCGSTRPARSRNRSCHRRQRRCRNPSVTSQAALRSIEARHTLGLRSCGLAQASSSMPGP